ncbi:unnamed protein product [Didymodactylos carnosus]|uniref:Deoxynucleoside kinase domain-containing protein n=2 Tax=Didymodactylos carnosus TaxID=1234261 RepID=A0A814BCC7_9BILA|nr:unnamed protein product [Didymodactylos carnosus]CAF3703118.1 unnamed protein product [Didymodactylos carnosus]
MNQTSPSKITKKKFSIAVEGNIGSGKSTILSLLDKSYLCDVVVEPIESWTNVNGHNLLAMLYKDPVRWGMTFQAYAQMTLTKLHALQTKKPVKVMERSIYSARYCFVENLYRSKILQQVEHEILNEWFNFMTENGRCNLDMIIYLRTSPEVCLERIKARNRPEEKSIDLNYLTALNNLHEQWLIQKKPYVPCAPVLIVDANQNQELVYKEANEYLTNLVC